MSKKTSLKNTNIVENHKARFNYQIIDVIEAGLVLQGWEVKSLRAKKVNLQEAFVYFKHSEAFLKQCHMTPLATTTHEQTDANRSRKLLLSKHQIMHLIGHTQRQGITLVPLKLYWKANRIKVCIALAKGKKIHDKRADLKEKDRLREAQRQHRHDH